MFNLVRFKIMLRLYILCLISDNFTDDCVNASVREVVARQQRGNKKKAVTKVFRDINIYFKLLIVFLFKLSVQISVVKDPFLRDAKLFELRKLC